jgi:hypothetical protein
MSAGHGDHSDLWAYIEGLREDLGRAEERIRDLEDGHGDLADEPEPAEYDPGPECDDEGGMSEYRYAGNPDGAA